MATDIPRAVRTFLDRQVLRRDYLLINEPLALRSGLPYELKLERLHALCMYNGYIQAAQAENTRRWLYDNPVGENQCLILMLVQAYLPECVSDITGAIPAGIPRQSAWQARSLTDGSLMTIEMQRDIPGVEPGSRISLLHWQDRHYQLTLPPEIHALLIDHDGALLAA